MLKTLILGAGPGGTGPLIWAAQIGALQAWLKSGVALVDSNAAIGGTIGRYIINSDSFGGAYLELLESRPARAAFEPLVGDPATREIERMRRGFPPLATVGQYLRQLGVILARTIADSDGGEFIPHASVGNLSYRTDGALTAEITEASGGTARITAKTAILALGGRHDWALHWTTEILPGVRLADYPAAKIMSSDLLFTAEGRQRAAAIIGAAPSPRVAILGGSHSGFSAAWVMTTLMPEVAFSAGDIAIFMRREPPIFYENREAAEADDYPVSSADICPRTLRVHRLGGLRGDGRELWRCLTRRFGTVREERVAMIPLHDRALSPMALRRHLDEAALIVTAFGYRARTVPIFDARGRRIALNADRGGTAVGPDGRLLDVSGQPLANLFCIGLGTGYRPLASMGGEASFTGQLNSLWLYQNDIGRVVYEGVRRSASQSGPRCSRGFRSREKMAIAHERRARIGNAATASEEITHQRDRN